METLKKQILFTENNCNACNRCIYTCPMPGANYSHTVEGNIIISVDNSKCISCGQCIDNCKIGARQYMDDTEAFFESLEKGEKISLLIDPSILLVYGAKTYNLFGYLKERGVDKIYDVSIGGDISVWAHMHYLIDNYDNPDKAFLSHICPTVVNYFEKNRPDLLGCFVPVQSPLMSAGIYARKYRKETEKIAYIGPCISALDEINDGSNKGIIDYCVTIRALLDKLSSVELNGYNADYDYVGRFIGRLLPMKGTVKDIMSLLFPNDDQFAVFDSADFQTERIIDGFATTGSFRPLLAEFVSCSSGCLFGPCLYHEKNLISDVFLQSKMIREEVFADCTGKMGYEDYRKVLDDIMAEFNIKYEDFTCEYNDRYVREEEVSSIKIAEAFDLLHKDTREKRNLDCSACGYPSCAELAKAIALGYAVPENCAHYLSDELELRYYKDKLTGRYNKDGFILKVNELFREKPNAHYMIAVASVNNLNVINDIYGFEIGDNLIKDSADFFEEELGSTGIVARLGGGDFFLCFEYDEKLISLLKEKSILTFTHEEISFPVSVRMGLYDAYKRDKDLQTMINLATLTMERIEETSNNVLAQYDDDIRDKIAKEADISAKMHDALAHKEFVPYFQPQFNHKTTKMIGAETLCRWIDADGKMISPGVFIPIFEKNGFIKKLDRYMWECVFAQVLEWENEGINVVPISVNVSRLSVMEEDFYDAIKELAEKYPINRDKVHFEITESAYTNHQEKLIGMVKKIRKLGFKIAMDDFGSGYSSLNTLKNVPIDILKLDMGFLSDEDDERGATIIKNVAVMARELTLEMVSEGVETKKQADFLSDVGCEIIQGYYYAKPMPLEQFEVRLKSE